MWGWVAATVGTILYAGACYIFNKLTEEEREFQRELRREHRRFRENIERMAQEYKNKAKEELQREYNSAVIEQEEILKRAYEINKREVFEYYELIKENVKKRIELKKKTLEDVNAHIEEIQKMKKSNITTYIRNRSFNIIEIELSEAKNYLQGYLKYLEEYDKKLERDYNHNLGLIEKGKFYKFELEPFEFLLPEFYPYFGKVIEVENTDINNEGKFEKKIEGLYHPKNFKVVDLDNLEKFQDKNIKIPMMLESFDKESKCWEVNIGKGLLIKNLMEQPGLGIDATVEKIERNFLILNYLGVKLRLNFENLINPRVIPLRGATLTVYPMEIKKEFRGSYMPRVTEDIKESVILEYISDIPLLVDKKDEEKFKKYFLEKNKENSLYKNNCLNWRVGKIAGDDSVLKLQLGENIVILAKKPNSKEDRQCLKFLDFSEEKFKPDDIFISINGTFATRIDEGGENFSQDEIDSMNAFLLLLEMEFRNQMRILEAAPGVVYYNKWIDITEKLVNYMQKDKEYLICELTDFALKREDKNRKIRIWNATIINFEAIEEKLKKIMDRGRVEFVIENEIGNYYDVRFFTELEDNRVEITEKLADNYLELLKEKEIVEEKVYVKKFPYAEIQQKKALNDFLTSNVENPNIKLALLSGKNIEEIEEEKKITIENFFNENIQKNIHQRKIVEDVINSKDIFYIQGPPGTGKTTVIKEIILQQLKLNPNSNILITSQTNVAVDNVLKGLKEYQNNIEKNELLRCGNDEKIAEEIKEFSFDNIVEKYKKDLQNIYFTDENEKKIHDIWLEYINDSKTLKNELGELLLKSKKIIGATCVGIANKKIGLEDISFDLVIVDEASKALPAEILIPLNKAKKCVIIGDHKQLPPTLNKALTDKDEIEIEDREYCQDELFEKSMFEKLFEDAPEYSKGMLKTQYRMPNSVGSMVSRFFYDGKLENGGICQNKKSLYFEKNLNWIDTSNIKDNLEIDTQSPYNPLEVEIISNLIQDIRKRKIDERIAVITPYKGQKRKILEALRKAKLTNRVVVDTVDSFQGDEAEIVIFSVTRAKKKTNFFSTDARLNVAFSRAKNELIIVGSVDYFRKKYGKESKLFEIANFINENGNIIKISK